jgi:uracil-DNA glycosylase family 4
MFVGEGPGHEEDKQGLPFVGRSGKLLDRLMLEEIGVARDRCYIANVVKCRPPGNRDPVPEEVASCRPFLDAQLEAIDPSVVVTLGNFATKLLLETADGIRRVRGRSYPFRRGVLVPTYHPAAVLRGGGEQLAQMRADLVRAKRALA